MSFWSELKRRNVIRVGVAYLVGAWLLLQITDVLMSVLGLPAFTGKLVFALLLIGFVPALAFAWAYQVTPEGLRRDTGAGGASVETARNLDRVTIAMLVLVAALVLVDRYLPREKGSEPFSEVRSDETLSSSADKGTDPIPLSTADETPSLAVLPFTNMSPDADNEYFADGISEELLNLLVGVDGLRVPSRTSSFAYKGLNKDIREIASELQVNHILEGSVRKAGNQVRITAQLIDTQTDTHLWSETWNRELADIFAIQEEIANHIVEALKGVLESGPIQHRPTDNLEAYTFFLQGRHLFQQRGAAVRDAERLLGRAVELDPEFAEAWATLAVTLTVMPNYIMASGEETLAAAADAADKALALQPGNATAMLALAQVRFGRMDMEGGLALLEQAIDIEPDNDLAQLWYGVSLMKAGYLTAAGPHFDHAVRVAPTSGVNLDWLARNLVALGLYEEALALADAALQLGRPQAIVPITDIARLTGDHEIVRSRLDPGDPLGARQVEMELALVGDSSLLPEALALADEVEANVAVRLSEYLRLEFYLAAGDVPGFFGQLKRIMRFDDSIPHVVWSPAARSMRESEAMQDWIHFLGLETLWAARGAPDLCTLEGARWRCR